MNRTRSLVGTLLIALLVSTPLIAGGLPEITIDCDNNESLQKALNELDRLGGGRVRVTGTCHGSIDARSASFIEIVR